MLSRAIHIAKNMHRGQTDKGGMPYINHPIHLMKQMDTVEEKIVAVLHDVIEDSLFTLADLQEEGFTETVIASLRALTKQKGESYEAYIQRITEDRIATKVKLADLQHNMDLNRLEKVTETDRKRFKKYQKSRQVLMKVTSE